MCWAGASHLLCSVMQGRIPGEKAEPPSYCLSRGGPDSTWRLPSGAFARKPQHLQQQPLLLSPL